jgi:hypothetical protein
MEEEEIRNHAEKPAEKDDQKGPARGGVLDKSR